MEKNYIDDRWLLPFKIADFCKKPTHGVQILHLLSKITHIKHSVLNVKAPVGAFNMEKVHVRVLHCDCEIFSRLHMKLRSE